MKTGFTTITALILVGSLAVPAKAEDSKPVIKLLKNNLCLNCNHRENLQLAQRNQKGRPSKVKQVQPRRPNIPKQKLNSQPRRVEKLDPSKGSEDHPPLQGQQKDQDMSRKKKLDISPQEKQKHQGVSKGEIRTPAKEKHKERKSRRIYYGWYDYPSSRWHNYLFGGWYYPSGSWSWESYLHYQDRIDQEGRLLNQDEAEYAKALAYYEQSLAIAREIRDRQREADILKSMGMVYEKLGQYAKALEYYDQSLAIAKELNNRQAEADLLKSIGTVHEKLGQ